jgi:hypothetical protein
MRQILAPDAIFGTQGITQEDKEYPFTGVSSSDSKMMLLFQQREVW